MSNYRLSQVTSGAVPQNLDSKDIELDVASLRVGVDQLRLVQAGAGATASLSTDSKRLKVGAPLDSDDVARLETVQNLITIFQSGAYWQDPVTSEITVPPASPATAQRHLVATSGTGAFSGQDGKIAQWSGTAWVFTNPLSGFVLNVLNQSRKIKVYLSSQWLNLSFSGQWLEKEFPAVGVSGQTAFQTTPEIPMTGGVVVEVFRNGLQMRLGASNDYVVNITTSTVTFGYAVPEASIIQVRVYPE
jgi:hypothetical protein